MAEPKDGPAANGPLPTKAGPKLNKAAIGSAQSASSPAKPRQRAPSETSSPTKQPSRRGAPAGTVSALGKRSRDDVVPLPAQAPDTPSAKRFRSSKEPSSSQPRSVQATVPETPQPKSKAKGAVVEEVEGEAYDSPSLHAKSVASPEILSDLRSPRVSARAGEGDGEEGDMDADDDEEAGKDVGAQSEEKEEDDADDGESTDEEGRGGDAEENGEDEEHDDEEEENDDGEEEDDTLYELDSILGWKLNDNQRDLGAVQLQIQWRNHADLTWEPEDVIQDTAEESVVKFWETLPAYAGTPPGKRRTAAVRSKLSQADRRKAQFHMLRITSHRGAEAEGRKYHVAWVGYREKTWETAEALDREKLVAYCSKRKLPLEPPPKGKGKAKAK